MKKSTKVPNAFYLVVTALCACAILVFVPLLIFNAVYAIKAAVTPDDSLPSVFGLMPLIESTDEMAGSETGIQADDLLIFKQADLDRLEAGDVVAAKVNNKYAVATVSAVQTDEDEFVFVLNVAGEDVEVASNAILGEYATRFAHLGAFIEFSHSVWGIVVLIGGPALIFVIYDVLKKSVKFKRNRITTEQATANAGARYEALGKKSTHNERKEKRAQSVGSPASK